jgi:hypothetical protein
MTEDAVIGCAGFRLSVAANLVRSGLGVRAFGRHMVAWRGRMPEGMVLKSDGL